MRDVAHQDCHDALYSECLALLDSAAELDPAGDRAPEIQAVRDMLGIELRDEQKNMNAKPGGR
jgi:hypothetical protein